MKLAAYTWPSQQAMCKAQVVMLHGHGGYACYEFLKSHGRGRLHTYEGSWVETMNQKGLEVHAMDIQSHGLSEGIDPNNRCYFEAFDDLVQDAVLFLETVRKTQQDEQQKPLFLVGISMGGCLATLTTHARPELVQGVCLLCPMLSLEKQKKSFPNNVLLPLSRVFDVLTPKAKLGKIGKNVMFPELQAEFEDDDLTYEENPRVHVAMEYVKATSFLVKEMPNIQFPFVIFQSVEDTFVDKGGSEELYAKASSADKTLRLLEDRCHFLVHEPNNEQVLTEMIDWLEGRCGPAPS